jgi:hypothetical protein
VGDPNRTGVTRTPPAAWIEAEREIVRDCYPRLLPGESVTAVVGDLNARGPTAVPVREYRE